MSGRSRILGFGSAAVLVVAGIAGAIGFSGTLGEVLALVLIGLGFVLAVALVFLEVGLSEDRERERESRRGAQGQRPSSARQPPSLSRKRRNAARRMDRMRGSRRRLR